MNYPSCKAVLPADDFEFVKATIEEQFEKGIEEIYSDFDETPFASASIGQVHRATLKPGVAENGDPKAMRDVVVKVRHKDIQSTVETDLDIISGLAQLAERVEDFRSYEPSEVVSEMARMMRNELGVRARISKHDAVSGTCSIATVRSRFQK